MLFTKDVKVIKSEDKKSYQAFVFDKPNLEFADNDKITDHEPKTDGKLTKLPDGSEFKGSKPELEVTGDTSDDAVALLFAEAESYCESQSQVERKNKKGEVVANPYTQADGNPIPNAGKLYLLACATEAITAHIRLALDADNREKSVDQAAVRFATVKNFIKAGKAKDEADGYKKLAKLESMELIEAADEKGEELSMSDAMLQIGWYQDSLKSSK